MMTSDLERYGMIGTRLAYELSSGRGIVSPTLWGVTIVELCDDGTTIRRSDISTCFPSRGQAEAHISRVRRDHVLIQ
jgi:hypothetical protein